MIDSTFARWLYAAVGLNVHRIMEHSKLKKEIEDNIKRLSRGLMQSEYSLAYKAYKNLYNYGHSALNPLQGKILEVDWSHSRYKELSKYVSGIFSLIHDIDEETADKIRRSLSTDGCPKHIQAIIDSTCEFSVKNYLRYQVSGIDIFEHRKITKKCNIQSYMEKWLSNVAEGDLSDISLLYIIRRDDIVNWAGTYTPVLFKITVLWNNPYKEGSILFKLFSIFTEHTLYHEIGHHAHRHTFKQDRPDKEKEADRYAYQIMKKSHPKLSIFAKILSKLGMKSERNYYRWGL